MTSTTTIATLTSQLNTLIEKQASVIRNAEAFAEDLERFETPLKELKKIASEWNVTPQNKTRKASYIAALQDAHAEKNGLSQMNSEIKALQFKRHCADAQEQANVQQEMIRVIHMDDGSWWVGTDETFKAIYPGQGMVICHTAHPEKPAVITQEIEVNGTTYTVAVRDEEELTQEIARLTNEVNAAWQEVNQIQEMPLQGVTSYIINNYAWQTATEDTLNSFRDPQRHDKEAFVEMLQPEKTDNEILAEQGVASFFSSLAVFSAHDILPFDIVGDIDMYNELKSQWDAMNGDELCQCDWCNAEPLQYQEETSLQTQEEVQFAAALYAHVVLQPKPLSYVDIFPTGNITISSHRGNITLSAHEAYNLLNVLYQHKSTLYQHTQQDESE